MRLLLVLFSCVFGCLQACQRPCIPEKIDYIHGRIGSYSLVYNSFRWRLLTEEYNENSDRYVFSTRHNKAQAFVRVSTKYEIVSLDEIVKELEKTWQDEANSLQLLSQEEVSLNDVPVLHLQFSGSGRLIDSYLFIEKNWMLTLSIIREASDAERLQREVNAFLWGVRILEGG